MRIRLYNNSNIIAKLIFFRALFKLKTETKYTENHNKKKICSPKTKNNLKLFEKLIKIRIKWILSILSKNNLWIVDDASFCLSLLEAN